MTRKQLDYGAIRDTARFETVLANYGLEMRGNGAERMNCFACGEKGRILDFVARMENCAIGEAARLLADWCDVSGASPAPKTEEKVRREPTAENRPLGFILSLDPDHPYLAERGMSEDTVARFGLGYCDRGIMKGRVCIPIHDVDGRLVANAGRWPGSNPPPEEPRYRLPRGFRKRLVLFNYHRVRDATRLVIVEGCWSVFRLDALGIASVALMGRTLSDEQEEIIRRSHADNVTLLLDGDEAGRAATEEILPRLARHMFVHAPTLPDGAEPDTMDEDTLLTAIRILETLTAQD
jgi:DNA primase